MERQTLKTVYLRVLHNKVSDIVEAESSDLCRVKIHLSYRVNFEGDSDRWFNVENYVRFLCDHTRSILRHAIKQQGVETFYANAARIIRDTVLGPAEEERRRPGRLFEENGMRIYDVEVLDVTIGDEVIAKLLVQAQHTTVQQTLEVAAQKRSLEASQEKERIKQRLAEAEDETQQLLLRLQTGEAQQRLLLNLAKIEAEAEARQKQLETKLADQETLDKINTAELARQRAEHELELELARRQLEQRLEEVKAEVAAVVDKASAVSPQLVAALQAFSDKALAEKMAESMAPLAILGGHSIADVFSQLLKGTVLENILVQRDGQG
jgi:major vault protein